MSDFHSATVPDSPQEINSNSEGESCQRYPQDSISDNIKFDPFLFDSPQGPLLNPSEQKMLTEFLDMLVKDPFNLPEEQIPFTFPSSSSTFPTVTGNLPSQQQQQHHTPSTPTISNIVLPSSFHDNTGATAAAAVAAAVAANTVIGSNVGFGGQVSVDALHFLKNTQTELMGYSESDSDELSSESGAPPSSETPSMKKKRGPKPKIKNEPISTLPVFHLPSHPIMETSYMLPHGIMNHMMPHLTGTMWPHVGDGDHLVKGALSTEALRQGMKSALKTYGKRKVARGESLDDSRDDDKKKKKKESSPQAKELLTEEEKRFNHIASEKKRRNNIKLAFQTMSDLVPSLKGGSYSKATIMNKANEYIYFLKERNASLALELQRANQLLQAAGINPGPSLVNSHTLNMSTEHEVNIPPSDSHSLLSNTFQRMRQSDEAKILMIWVCFVLSIVDLSGFSGSSSYTSSRSTLSLSFSDFNASDFIWLFVRICLALFACYASVTYDLVKATNTNFQLALQARELGEKASNIMRESYLIKALVFFGCSIPSNWGVWLSLVWQLSRQLSHMLVVGQVVEKFVVKQMGVQKELLEISKSFYLLTHYYTSAEKVPVMAWVSLLRALNIAESIGPEENPLLAEIYSGVAFHLQFQLPNWKAISLLAQYYRYCAHKASEQTQCSAKTRGYLALHDSWQRMSMGQLSEASSGLLSVQNYFLKCNRPRSAWEVIIFRAITLYLQGKLRECLHITHEINELGYDNFEWDKRGDADAGSTLPSYHWWNKLVYGLGIAHGQTPDTLLSLLDEMNTIKREHSDVKWTENSSLQEMLSNSLRSFALSRKGLLNESLLYIEKSHPAISAPHRTLFNGASYLSHLLVTDSLCLILLKLHKKDPEAVSMRERILKTANKSILVGKNFAKEMPFAVPRSLLLQGIVKCSNGEDNLGMELICESEIQSVKINLPMDQAQAIFFRTTLVTPTTKDAELSESIFKGIGATFEAERSKELAISLK